MLLIFPLGAHAYLDPGTGSIILQGVIAAIATVGFTVKNYWHRIQAWFHGDETTPAEDHDGAENEVSEK